MPQTRSHHAEHVPPGLEHRPDNPDTSDDAGTIVIEAPAPIDARGLRVFLGGAIDMGSAVNWQADVIRALSGHTGLVLINPRRAEFQVADLDRQIDWELAALEAADLILMWFPAGALAPISMLETGLYLRSGKIILGADPSYSRRRNLELTAARYDIPIVERLDDLIAAVTARHRRG